MEFLTQSVRSTWKRWKNGITREREREDDLFTCDAVLHRRQKGTERKIGLHTHKRNYKKKSPCVPLFR